MEERTAVVDPTADRLGGTIADVRALLEAVAGASLDDATDAGLCLLASTIEDAGRLLDALRVSAAAEIAHRSRRGLGADALCVRYGKRDGRHLLESLTRISPAEAARRVRVGRGIRPDTTLTGVPVPAEHPAVAEALAAGALGLDAAAVIIRCLDDARATACDDDLRIAESVLVDAAATSCADEIGVAARAWREALDPDGAEPRDERLERRRAFRLGRERDGLTPFSGALEPVGAALLRAAFAEADKPGNTPRFLSDADRARGTTLVTVNDDGEEEIEFLDSRTRDQRHYDVVTGLLTAGIRASTRKRAPMGTTASVTAVITLDDLRRHCATGSPMDAAGLPSPGSWAPDSGTPVSDFGRPAAAGIGWLDGIDEPVSAATVAELVCQAGFAPLLLGDNGEILHLGRTRRAFSLAQVTALAARDGGCVNCGVPPSWCDAHHVTEWSREGPTDIDNGALLCRPCHRMIHHSDHRLAIIDGRAHILAPPALDPAQSWRPLRNHRGRTLTELRRSRQ